jgi:hypothetical protein
MRPIYAQDKGVSPRAWKAVAVVRVLSFEVELLYQTASELYQNLILGTVLTGAARDVFHWAHHVLI